MYTSQRQGQHALAAAESALELWRGAVRAGGGSTAAARALGRAAAEGGGLTGAATLLEAFGRHSEVVVEAAVALLRDAAELLLPCMGANHARVLFEASGRALKVR